MVNYIELKSQDELGHTLVSVEQIQLEFNITTY